MPSPNGVLSVSPCTTSMSSGGMPELLARRSGRTSSRGPGPGSAPRAAARALPVGCTRSSAAVGHAEAEDVHVLARPGADPSVKNEIPMPISSPRPRRSRRCSARPQLVVAGHLHGQLQRPRVVPGVVLPPGRRGVRELLGPQQVLHPQLGRVHAQLGGEHVDHPLDQVHRLGDPERAGVRDPARRLVGVHPCHLAVRRLQVVASR